MKFYKINENKKFIGRKEECSILNEIHNSSNAEIIVIYGRRRIGKTELIEQFFRKEKVWKFEGIQPDAKNKKSSSQEKEYQMLHCLRLLGKYLDRENEFSLMKIYSWSQFFDLLLPYLKKHKIILYFEEIQWLANYQDEFMAELKQIWDNEFRHIKKLRIIFSGSSPSFIIGQFLSNSAMYNRSEHLIHLRAFSLNEIQAYFPKMNKRELMLAALCTGGICEYLKQLKGPNSIFKNLCKKSFSLNAFFVYEYDKIFVSSMTNNKYYSKIIKFLAREKYATRNQIAKKVLNQTSAGGELTKILIDLESCNFIERYNPIGTDSNTLLVRYTLADEYLQFYFKFIFPNIKKIESGAFEKKPSNAINIQQFSIVMGLNFERWCRKNHYKISQLLNFGNIDYLSGSFFNRKTQKEYTNFQIDLMYIRKDHRIIICEIKYYDGLVRAQVRNDVNEKIEKFKRLNSKYKNYTYETALITTEGAVPTLHDYFDHIITFKDLFTK